MKAIIRTSNWHGEQGIHQARTIKAPRQSIPTFVETVELLMKVGQDSVHFDRRARGSLARSLN